jgi:hypothetical protein
MSKIEFSEDRQRIIMRSNINIILGIMSVNDCLPICKVKVEDSYLITFGRIGDKPILEFVFLSEEECDKNMEMINDWLNGKDKSLVKKEFNYSYIFNGIF